MKSTVKRFVLRLLSTSPGLLTALRITDAWIEARGLRCDDKTRVVIHKRIGASLISLRTQGTVRNEGMIAGYKEWVVT